MTGRAMVHGVRSKEALLCDAPLGPTQVSQAAQTVVSGNRHCQVVSDKRNSLSLSLGMEEIGREVC